MVAGRRKEEGRREVESRRERALPLRRLLIVAGYDPSGAGIDADLEAAARLRAELHAAAREKADPGAAAKSKTDLLAKAQTKADLPDMSKSQADLLAEAESQAELLAKTKSKAGLPARAKSKGDLPVKAKSTLNLLTAEMLDLEAIPVVTARTDQDAMEVRSIGARPPAEWSREALEAALEGIAAVKFGLLPGEQHIREARELVRKLRSLGELRMGVVVDPVIRASSGGVFLDERAVEILRGELIADGVVLTPNLAEAAVLACMPVRELESSCAARLEAARILLALGAAAVVVKGGHGREDPVRDLVAEPEGAHRWIERPRVRGGGIRGSGCRFATRLAGGLAIGRGLAEAAAEAGEYVAGEIARRAGEG